MKNISVLGAGLVGRAIVLDLHQDKNFRVTAVDSNAENLSRLPDEVDTKQADAVADLEELVSAAEMVVNALPGSLGFGVLKRLITVGKDVVDISFFPEDMFELRELASQKGVTVVCDMGVAPGMSNLLSAYAARSFDKVRDVTIAVGGLPKVRTKPFEYKAPFSPADVLEEYTRQAHIREKGEEHRVEPLTALEKMEFEQVGTLEAFVTDGLRSLLHYLDAENMVEKTLRYPGYAEKIQLLKDIGLFGEHPVKVKDSGVKPLDLTSKLLLPMWKLEEGEQDFTVMRIAVEGLSEGQAMTEQWDLYDEYDRKNDIHSMARTTGYAATAVVRQLAAGEINRKGLVTPEELSEQPQVVEKILEELRAKNVVFTKSTATKP